MEYSWNTEKNINLIGDRCNFVINNPFRCIESFGLADTLSFVNDQQLLTGVRSLHIYTTIFTITAMFHLHVTSYLESFFKERFFSENHATSDVA